jgi:rhodanese-related sulfurtransferase
MEINIEMRRNTFITVLLVILIIILGAFLFYNMSSPLAMNPEEAKDLLKKGFFDAVVDVRTDAEWNMGRYPLAIHIPVNQIKLEIEQRIPDKKSKILFYCNTSTRARMAAEEAERMGYVNVRYLIGTHKNIL